MNNQAAALNTISNNPNCGGSSRARSEHVQHKVITSVEDLLALEHEWADVFGDCANSQPAFLSFAWCLEWCRHFLSDMQGQDRLSIVCGYADGRLVSVWPLMAERRIGLTTLKWLGAPVSQYGDALVLNDPRRTTWIREGLQFIKTSVRCDLIDFSRVRGDSLVGQVLAEDGCHPVASEKAPFVNLRQFKSIDDFRKAQSKKTRRTRRRMRVLLEERGSLTFELHRGGCAAGSAIEQAFAFKAAWLEQRGIISRAFSDKRVLEFWTGLAHQDPEQSGLVVAVLSCGQQPLAIEIGLRTGDTHVAHIGSFHPEFEKVSPGSLQMEELISVCLEDDVSTYDLLAPHDTYKERWASGSVAVHDYVLPVSAAGMAWSKFSGLRLQKLAKDQFAKLPKFVRQSIAQMSGRRSMAGSY